MAVTNPTLMQIQQKITATQPSRRPYPASALLVLILGYSARQHSALLPPFIGAYAPDALWALLVFLLVACVTPSITTWHKGFIALAFAYGIEGSQLYQAPWINSIRATRMGGLLLGHGFLWSDLLCYGIGIGLGALLDSWIKLTVIEKEKAQ